MKKTRFVVMADGSVGTEEMNYFEPGTEVFTTDPNSPLVQSRVYRIESCSETEPVCRVTAYHWPVDTSTLQAVV